MNKIHDAYMDGYFKGKSEIIKELAVIIDDQMDELKKQIEEVMIWEKIW